MLDLDPDQEEIYLSNNDILQMISTSNGSNSLTGNGSRNALGLVVLELDVQTIFNADFHLDRIVAVWRHSKRVNP